MSGTLLSRKTVTARKPHSCWVCGGIAIKVGDSYVREAVANDGTVWTLIECTGCASVRADVWDYADGQYNDGVSAESYLEWANENADDPRASALKDRVQASWLAWHEVHS